MRTSTLVVALILLDLPSATAQIYIDQQQPIADPFTEASYYRLDFNNLRQGFSPDATYLAGAGVFISGWDLRGQPAPPLTGIVSLRVDAYDPFLEALVTVASGETTFSNVAGGGWADVFWNPVIVDPTRLYGLNVSADVPFLVTGAFGTAYQLCEKFPYEFGKCNGVDYETVGPDANCTNCAGFEHRVDLTFRTFAVVTPEPTTVLLLATGLVGIAGIQVRRRRRVSERHRNGWLRRA